MAASRRVRLAWLHTGGDGKGRNGANELTDIGVASSAEAIAIAFRARPNTRSFGTATCGISTAVAQFPLKQGGRIAVVTSVMADRTKKPYGKTVDPDEVVNDPAEVIPRALSWLRR